MNIEANALATKALQGGVLQPIIPFDPATGAMLTIGGKVITRHLEATIQQHKNTAPLKEYFCKRFSWCINTFSSIDWVAFSMAYTKFPRTRTFFHKFGWKQLPTDACLHWWTPSYEHQCPLCSQDAKTDNHLFQCQHSFASNGEMILSILYTTLTVNFLIQIYSPLPRSVSWPIFRIVCPYLRNSTHVIPIQNYGSLQINKLRLDGTNLCGANKAKNGARANMYTPKDTS
jgi:hypothetical protein